MLMANNKWGASYIYGHNTILDLLATFCLAALMPYDSIPCNLVLGMIHVKFEVLHHERLIELDVKTDKISILIQIAHEMISMLDQVYTLY